LRILRAKRPRHFPDVSDAPERREQVIATGRVFLAGGALVAAFLGPIRPVQNSELIAVLLVVYLIASLILWATLRWRPTAEPSVCIGAHAADLFCTTALTVLSRGPGSPFFLFFVFVLLAAAYRWGFRGTMLTAGTGIVLLVGEAYVLIPSSLPALLLRAARIPVAEEFAANELVLRCAYLLMIGLLLGYLAEGEHALQSEATTTAQIINKAQVGGGLKATLGGMFHHVLLVFGVARGMIVSEDLESGRMFLWDERRPADGGPMELDVRPVEGQRQGDYLWATETDDWFARKAGDGRYRIHRLKRWSPRQLLGEPVAGELPTALRGSGAVLAAPFRLGKQWQGWVYLIHDRAPLNWRKDLRFLRRIVDASAPAAYNAYLLSRMRSQIGAQERGRLARELHDGAIQSLLAAELQMHALRRRAADGPAQPPDSLDGVEDLIHQQVLNLREMMERIRPIDPDPRQLRESLAEQVEKFQRETGIEATFDGDGRPVRLTGRACRELIRILQELLFNVRRHSGASRVDVRLTSRNGACRLQVADNGRGFDFTGRHDQAALEAMRKGPRVVQERLRLVGGYLEVESQPGKGARLEVTVPQREA
jgi:signal transduction histidine kinase